MGVCHTLLGTLLVTVSKGNSHNTVGPTYFDTLGLPNIVFTSRVAFKGTPKEQTPCNYLCFEIPTCPTHVHDRKSWLHTHPRMLPYWCHGTNLCGALVRVVLQNP